MPSSMQSYYLLEIRHDVGCQHSSRFGDIWRKSATRSGQQILLDILGHLFIT